MSIWLKMTNTPKELGYYMPAEWEKHSAVWLAWPYGVKTFPGILDEIEIVYCKIIKELMESEKVKLLVLSEEEKSRIINLMKKYEVDASEVIFYIEKYSDVWTRDYTPITLYNKNNKEYGYVKWIYNAYGREDNPRFTELMLDNEVFRNIYKREGKELFEPQMILEGGAIETNGEGVILTTEECLLNENRSNFSKEETEKYLKDYLNVEKIIWLGNGLLNDHTDGHIDEIARFVSSNTIVCAYEENENDENYQNLKENYEKLITETNINGDKFNVIKLPMPHMRFADGEKAPVSYTNFYIGNKIILMPIYNDENDKRAIEIMSSIFKDKKIIPIDCTKLIEGGGGLHCITMQEY